MSQAGRSIAARAPTREIFNERKELSEAALWLAAEAGRETDALARCVLLDHALQLWQRAHDR